MFTYVKQEQGKLLVNLSFFSKIEMLKYQRLFKSYTRLTTHLRLFYFYRFYTFAAPCFGVFHLTQVLITNSNHYFFMAILKGIQGKRSGRIGELVYSVYRGVQIEKSAPAQVTNPQTAKQVAQRARMKLMTQLAAAMACAIAFKAEGTISARNKFVSANFPQSYYSGTSAAIILENVQLADGKVGLPAVSANRADTSKLVVSLVDSPSESIVAVTYAIFRKTDEGNLELFALTTEDNAGDEGTFAHEFRYTDAEITIYAFGIMATSGASKAVYYDLAVAAGNDTASLLNAINLQSSGLRYSVTRGTTLFIGDVENESTESGKVRLYVTAGSGGTATGAGQYVIGTEVTVTATPDSGNTFVGWKKAGSDTIISTARSYTFTINELTDLIAVFEVPQGGGFDAGD